MGVSGDVSGYMQHSGAVVDKKPIPSHAFAGILSNFES